MTCKWQLSRSVGLRRDASKRKRVAREGYQYLACQLFLKRLKRNECSSIPTSGVRRHLTLPHYTNGLPSRAECIGPVLVEDSKSPPI